MNKAYEAFSDFLNDCVVEKDLLCNLCRDKSFELFPVQVISEMKQEEGEPKTCLVSLRNEPKVG